MGLLKRIGQVSAKKVAIGLVALSGLTAGTEKFMDRTAKSGLHQDAPKILKAADSLMEGTNIYRMYKDWKLQGELSVYSHGIKESTDDDLIYFLENGGEQYGILDRTVKILGDRATPDSQLYMSDILANRKFSKHTRYLASRILFENADRDVPMPETALANLARYISPLDPDEIPDTNGNVFDVLGKYSYKEALPSILAVARLDYDSFITKHISEHARRSLAYFPSRRTLDILIETSQKKSVAFLHGDKESIDFAALALDTADSIGSSNDACGRVTGRLEDVYTWNQKYRGMIWDLLKKHECPSQIFDRNWRYFNVR